MDRIKQFFKFMKDVWNGERFPSPVGKFLGLCAALGFAHVILCLMFLYSHVTILVIYNIFSAIFYFCTCVDLKRTGKLFSNFVAWFIEIVVAACVFTLLCGWDLGYMLYLIGLCPVAFFVIYSMPGRKHTMTTPAIFTLAGMVVFMAIRAISAVIPAPFADSFTKKVIDFHFNFNCALIFISIIVFAVLFSLEVRQKEKELEEKNTSLMTISSIDPLTKLLNRRSMNDVLKSAVDNIKKTGELFTLAIGDIDNFKMVNDIHGHNVGDDVLMMVSNSLKSSLPENATLCRWGGEEFLILLRCPEDEAVPIMEQVRENLMKVTTHVYKESGDIDLGVTMTFGMSQYIHGFTIEQVVSVADTNLYKGKAFGKNRVVHSKTIIEEK